MSESKYWDTCLIKKGLWLIINRVYIPDEGDLPAEDFECKDSPLSDDMQKMAKRLLGCILLWESGIDICETAEMNIKVSEQFKE